MILYYPMIISQSVSPNVVPGIVKVAERFLLLYRMNDVMEQLQHGLDFKIDHVETQNGIITVDTPDPIKMESREFKYLPEETKGTKWDPSNEDNWDSSKAVTKFDLKNTDLRSIALEPTFTIVELKGPQGTATKMLGIKVLPMRATTKEENLVRMLQYDRYAGWLTSKALNVGRKATRKIARAWANTRLPFKSRLRDIEPTGKVRADVLLSKTTFGTQKKSNIFVVLNKIDLPENFTDPRGIRKIQKLGWENFVLVDDVNKTSYFCMRVLRGMCSRIPFSMLYQTLQQREAYESLEDIRKASSSIFKRRVTFPKAIGESKMDVLESYLDKLHDQRVDILTEDVLTEDISAFLNRLKPEKFKKFLVKAKPAIRQKSIEKLGDSLKKLNLPPVSEATLDRMLFKAGPKFRKVFKISDRVLSNTFQDANPIILKSAAYMVAVRVSKQAAGDVMKATKAVLKSFVRSVRKVMPKLKAPPEYIWDLAIGWVIVLISITAIAGTIGVAGALAGPFAKSVGFGAGALVFGTGGVSGAAKVAGATFLASWNVPEMLVVGIVVAVLTLVTTYIIDKVKSEEQPA